MTKFREILEKLFKEHIYTTPGFASWIIIDKFEKELEKIIKPEYYEKPKNE